MVMVYHNTIESSVDWGDKIDPFKRLAKEVEAISINFEKHGQKYCQKQIEVEPEDMNIVKYLLKIDDDLDRGLGVDLLEIGRTLYRNNLKNLSLWQYWLELNEIPVSRKESVYCWRHVFY